MLMRMTDEQIFILNEIAWGRVMALRDKSELIAKVSYPEMTETQVEEQLDPMMPEFVETVVDQMKRRASEQGVSLNAWNPKFKAP